MQNILYSKINITLIVFFYGVCAYSQSFEELNTLYYSGRNIEVVKVSHKINLVDSSAAFLEIIGNAFFQLNEFDSAIYLLNLALVKDMSSVSIYGNINLGIAYIKGGKIEEGMKALNKCMYFYYNKKDTIMSMIDGALGELYFEEKKTDSAVYYLKKCIARNYTKNKERAIYYLVRTYMECNEFDSTISLLRELDTMQLSSYKKYAKVLFDSVNARRNFKYSKYFTSQPHWTMVEGVNITYFFEDTSGWGFDSIQVYIKKHERAYRILDSIFHSNSSRKLTFYVGNRSNNFDFVKSKRDFGYTDPKSFICYVYSDQTIGHEMTHALSYWAWGYPPIYRSRLINEGLAVAFDMSKRNKYSLARRTIGRYKNIHSVLDIWDSHPPDLPFEDEVIYNVGGAFLAYLYQESTYNQFIALIKDQTIENAEKVYGKERFNVLIDRFNRKIGLD